ncbi:MAG: hypothetical protein Q8933_17680 [Bacteroidota bacterium]|nr:hypothetical protein [Bacteroidota bacterium]MDP4196833.1 hypothetical protein [Bacteroidota bacterium]
MNKNKTFAFVIIFSFVMSSFSIAQIKKAYRIDLLRLEEVYSILDKHAQMIWPGWNNYRQIPFLFNYPDGVRILVGHPNPPEEFKKIEELTFMGKQVYIDRSREFPLELNGSLTGGGGPIPFATADGKSIEVVEINVKTPDKEDKSASASRKLNPASLYPSEGQILIYIHELFHCFQKTFFTFKRGNLDINSDLNFAVYSELEANSLKKAFGETDTSKIRKFVKEFIAEREMKNKSFKDQEEINLSDDEFMEGGATYSEVMTLQLLKGGFTSCNDLGKLDSTYKAFRSVDQMYNARLRKIDSISIQTMETKSRCYQYGLYQALILDRIIPAWKALAQKDNKALDQILRESVKFNDAEKQQFIKEINESKEYRIAFERHKPIISRRDSIYNEIINLKGRTFVISFKQLEQFPNTPKNADVYSVGLMKIYPTGFDQVKINDVILKGKYSPILNDQIYYFKWVDREVKPAGKEYEIEYSKKEDDIYYNATIKTSGFTLEAPKIQIKENPFRIKINILSSVKI